jgi:MFS family permease
MTDNKITVKKHSNKRWIYVFTGIITMMLLGTVYSYSVFRESIENIYNVGTTLSGLPYTASLASYALLMFLSGKIINRINHKIVIGFGGLLIGIGWILSSLVSNIYLLTLTYGLIIGSGVGIIYGVPMHIVAKWFPKSKGLSVGFVLLGFGLSPFITAPAARILIENIGLKNTFLTLGISFIVILPILGFVFKYPEEGEVKEEDNKRVQHRKYIEIETKEMLKTKSFKGLYLNFTIGTMIGLTIIGLTSTIGTEVAGISPVNVAFFMSLFAVFNGLGRPLFGWLTDNISSKKTMILSYFLILTASIMMIVSKDGNFIIYGISFSLYWLNLGGWLAIAPASTISFFGLKHYTENYGVVFTGYGIGAIVGVISSGMIIDFLGSYEYLFYFTGGLSLLGILSSLKLIKN